MAGDFAVRNRTEDEGVVGKDVVHRQNAGPSVTGIGDPAHRLGAEELEALLAFKLDESSSKLAAAQNASLLDCRGLADPDVDCSDLVMVALSSGLS